LVDENFAHTALTVSARTTWLAIANGREGATTVRVVARTFGAFVSVVANDTFAKIHCALTGYTNAGSPVQSTLHSVFHRLSLAPITDAEI
jgi:hypothetical protein